MLISSHLVDVCSEASITPIATSDHAIISINLGEEGAPRGPGLWRFNSVLLQDERYVSEMFDTLETLKNDPPIADPVANWEWTKYVIRKETSAYEKKIREKNRRD